MAVRAAGRHSFQELRVAGVIPADQPQLGCPAKRNQIKLGHIRARRASCPRGVDRSGRL